jgi:hypothetical protein
MAGDLAVAPGPLATTKKEKALLVPRRFDGEVEKFVSRRGIGDLDMRPSPALDKLVTERLHPPMAVLAQQLLESWAGKASRPDGPPYADVNEDWRLKASAQFDRIDGFDKLGRVIAPAVVAPGEKRYGHLPFLLREPI